MILLTFYSAHYNLHYEFHRVRIYRKPLDNASD